MSEEFCYLHIITGGESSPYERFTLYICKNSRILFKLYPLAIQRTVCDDKGTHFHNAQLRGSKYMSQACYKTSTKMADSLMASYYNSIIARVLCVCIVLGW